MKEIATNLGQRGKSPRASVNDITETDEFYDADNMEDVPQLPADQTSSNANAAQPMSRAAVEAGGSADVSHVTMENTDVMIVEDFVETETILAHVSRTVRYSRVFILRDDVNVVTSRLILCGDVVNVVTTRD